MIGLALALAFLYVVDKANEATTLDKKLFQQASIVFFITCLISATESKIQWREKALKKQKTITAKADNNNLAEKEIAALGVQHLQEIK